MTGIGARVSGIGSRASDGALLLVPLLLLLGGCGGRGGDTPTPPAPPPGLAGMRIMLLPAMVPAPEPLDSALASRLTERAPATDWVLPTELQAAADRVPAWRLRLNALPRPILEMGRNDRRVGDPLYGALRQLGAIVHSDYAVVPVAVGERSDPAGVVVSLALAVVDIRGGRVLWLHTAEGERNLGRAEAVASVAETVARILVP